ncbi:alpha/beta hydrolase-fold protein [Sphingomonas donggukensis]|uniref:Alpha/beta hydrolase-fold protein n=1 Tax=Sphingomonas donggukensis TaxID=2949093 RepID=A0ABY4TRM8_9SPHN|nr:alpha/beta hydrolase-fold protein [Sphingomonas donggukensis]URW75035.1 alpha/beta hydrolase-fold protein [Sphingomonas donggukensis]
MRILTLLAGLLLSLAATAAHARDTGFLDRQLTVAGVAHRYQVYVPRDAKRGERLPVILALHGAGERGSDGLLQTDVGLGHAVRQHPERWRAIIVFPQAPADRLWQNSTAIALAALDATEREFRTDRARTYLAGLSMGGNGTWKIAYENPGRFAALVVICGFVQPIAIRDYQPIVPANAGDPYAAVARRIAKLPVWIVHGDRDDVVPVADSRAMAAALTAAGARVTYRELKGVNHNAWDPGFGDPALPAWLFAQRR